MDRHVFELADFPRLHAAVLPAYTATVNVGPNRANEQATKLAASWVKSEGLESALPNAPKITTGKVVAQENRIAVA